MRKFFKILAVVVVLCILPFLADAVVGAWDTYRNPLTRRGGVVMKGGPVHTGVNRRAFKEIRFRSKDMRMSLLFSGVSREDAAFVGDKLTGVVRFILNGELAAEFRVKTKSVMSKETSGIFGYGDSDNVALASFYDVQCHLEPISEKDRQQADILYGYEFERGEEAEISVSFDGYVPRGGEIIFSYSMCPRSLLRGTFLDFDSRFEKRGDK